MSERFNKIEGLDAAFDAAERDRLFREKVYEAEKEIKQDKEAGRFPIHFDSEHWASGAFAVLQLQKGIDLLGETKSDQKGGEFWLVTQKTIDALNILDVPFSEGVPLNPRASKSAVNVR